MRERLAEVGGKLDVETQRNQGFVLQASLPMEHAV
jgi:signal transduction histidine kinase